MSNIQPIWEIQLSASALVPILLDMRAFTVSPLTTWTISSPREAHARGTYRDSLLEAIDIVAHNGISSPASLEKLEAVWKEYDLAQDMVKACHKVSRLNPKSSENGQNTHKGLVTLLV